MPTINKVIHNFRHLPLLVVLGLAMAAASPLSSQAATYGDNFDSYTTGDLNGQGPWVSSSGVGSAQVVNSISESTPNSITKGGTRNVNYPLGVSVDEIYVSYDIYWDGTAESGSAPASYFRPQLQILRLNGTTWEQPGGAAGPTLVQIPEDEWVNLEFYISYDGGVNWYIIAYMDGIYFFEGSYPLSASPTVNQIVVDEDISTGMANHIFGDNLSVAWDGDIPPLPGSGTQIYTVTPPNDPSGSYARATSTAFAIEMTGNIVEEDFSGGEIVRINIQNNAGIPSNSLVGPGYSSGGVAICNWLFDWLCPPTYDDDTQITGAQTSIVNRTWEFPVEDSGAIAFATTTDLQQIGRYTMVTSIIQADSVFGFTLGSRTLVSTTTSFLVATSTWADIAHEQANSLVNQLGQEAAAANCTVDFSTLFGLTDLGDCLIYLFNGSASYLAGALSTQIADLTSRAPWGYATRVFIIFTDESIASSTLPSIAATVPAGLPMEGKSFDFSPWEPTQAAVAQLDSTPLPGGEGSVLDNFETYWNLMWGIIFGLWVMRELYDTFGGMDLHDENSGSIGKGIYAYRGLVQTRTKMHRKDLRNMQKRIVKGH